MSDAVKPEGWNDWGKPERQKTARYAEFESTGPGGSKEKRVPWSKQLSADEAKAITKDAVLGGWKP
jgi:pectinesterase